jgi:hypothetical protein
MKNRKVERGGGELRMEGVNLRYIVSTFINITRYSKYNNNILMKTLKK